MLNIVLHINPRIPWQARWSDFFINGFKKHNINVTVTTSQKALVGSDIVILFGPNTWKNLEKSGIPYIMVNRKFFGEEKHVAGDIVALSWSGFNGQGFHCVGEVSNSRINNFLDPNSEIQDWKTDGEQILLCGQADLARCTAYGSLERWYDKVKNITSMPLKFRPHPTRGEQKTLKEDLHNIKAAVVLNSTVSVDILLAGIPVITMDEGDATYSITGHTMDDIKYPDRLAMVQYLAHCQWHYSEIENGKFWEQLYPKSGLRLCVSNLKS